MRIDVFLAEKGFFASRSKARVAIEQGLIFVNGAVAEKPSLEVCGNEEIVVAQRQRFVSRAGEKLAHALTEFAVSTLGLTVLDIGASTGGFTDCLLQNGAKRVFALDVGSAQLDPRLRADSRVTVIENFNARQARKSDFCLDIDLIVMDVSFISQCLIYPACKDILPVGKQMITLIKPQFEAGRGNVGKGGIVKDPDGKIIAEITERIKACAAENGFEMLGFTPSPIRGGDGNKEYLALFTRKE